MPFYSDISPIPTRYRGYSMRSRSEGRFGVTFDHLDLRWDYEPQGFTISALTNYRPDFWLPDLGVYVEIKGQPPLPRDIARMAMLCYGRGLVGYIFWGGVPHPDWSDFDPDGSALAFFPDGTREYGHWICRCRFCGAVGIEKYGWSERLDCCDQNRETPGHRDTHDDSFIVAAYEAGRGARAEFGESA